MVAKIVSKNNGWYCSHCRMRQSKLVNRCEFCWSSFSNYEEALIEYMEEIYEDEVLDTKNRNLKIESDE